MTDEESMEPSDEDLIEEQLRFLREGGSAPDLGGLSPEEAAQVRAKLEIVEALANVGPSDVDLRNDPVAIRLGLVEAPSGDPVETDSDDPVTASVREAERRFSFVATRAATDGTEFERRFECRSMVENVLVVVAPDPNRQSQCAVHARSVFALSDELSAVAYCSAAAADASVFTYGDCHDKIDPASGWATGHPGDGSEPLSVALGRYFERSDPRWEAVESLEGLDTWEGLAEDVAAVVAAVTQRVARSTPQLPHKRFARDAVAALPESLFQSWAERVQSREVDAATIGRDIRELLEELAT